MRVKNTENLSLVEEFEGTSKLFLFDLDNCIMDLLGKVESNFDNYNRNRQNTYSFSNQLGEDAPRLYNQFGDPDFFRDLEFLSEGVSFIQLLVDNGHTVNFYTKRPLDGKDIYLSRLKEVFNHSFEFEVYNDRQLIKNYILKHDIVVDDCPENIEALRSWGLRVAVALTFYNHHQAEEAEGILNFGLQNLLLGSGSNE